MYRTPPKYRPTPSGAPFIRARSLLPLYPIPSPYNPPYIPHIWISRARARSRIRAGDERNSEFRMCEGLPAPRDVLPPAQRERERRDREKEKAEQSRVSPTKERITMPKRTRIVVRPADTSDNSQCAKCIGIESGRFIFAPTRPGLIRFNSFVSAPFVRIKNLFSKEISSRIGWY